MMTMTKPYKIQRPRKTHKSRKMKSLSSTSISLLISSWVVRAILLLVSAFDSATKPNEGNGRGKMTKKPLISFPLSFSATDFSSFQEEKKPEEKKPEEKKEEAKKPEEEKKPEKNEEKKEEKPSEESKEGKEAPPPPPPEEFVYRVFMHCEGCARKVKRSLRGFEGVEDVVTDCKAHKVVVKGKTADPMKVLDRIQRKSHRKVELLTQLPKSPAEDPKKAEEEKEKPKPEEKKEEPQVIIATLKVHMHCEACAQEIKKRIQRMKGVQSADPDLKSSQVAVKGVFDPQKLVEYVYKRTGKHAMIVKQEPEKKEEEKGKEKEEKKEEGGEKGKGEEEKKESKEGGEEAKEEEETKVDVKKYTMDYYYNTIYTTESVYAPQIFSDENPNACSVM